VARGRSSLGHFGAAVGLVVVAVAAAVVVAAVAAAAEHSSSDSEGSCAGWSHWLQSCCRWCCLCELDLRPNWRWPRPISCFRATATGLRCEGFELLGLSWCFAYLALLACLALSCFLATRFGLGELEWLRWTSSLSEALR